MILLDGVNRYPEDLASARIDKPGYYDVEVGVDVTGLKLEEKKERSPEASTSRSFPMSGTNPKVCIRRSR